MLATDRFEQVEIASVPALRDWLTANHARSEGVWLVTWRKSVPDRYVDRWDVLDALLCFGWIDGIRRKLDDDRTMQLIAPRRQQVWAQSYKERVERLEREGRMAEPGRAAVARAKQTGLWDVNSDVDRLEIPDDLLDHLRAAPPAEAWFRATAPSYRRNVLRWIALAKTPQTRARRLTATTAACQESRRLAQM